MSVKYGTIYRHGERAYEHRVIAERALGKPLPKEVEVHHHDNNGRNNQNGNLVICQDHAYHYLLHRRQRIVALGGNPNTQHWCGFCKAIRPIDQFWVRKTGEHAGLLTSQCKVCLPERKRLWKAKQETKA